jgi:hypothetical protein
MSDKKELPTPLTIEECQKQWGDATLRGATLSGLSMSPIDARALIAQKHIRDLGEEVQKQGKPRYTLFNLPVSYPRGLDLGKMYWIGPKFVVIAVTSREGMY